MNGLEGPQRQVPTLVYLTCRKDLWAAWLSCHDLVQTRPGLDLSPSADHHQAAGVDYTDRDQTLPQLRKATQRSADRTVGSQSSA